MDYYTIVDNDGIWIRMLTDKPNDEVKYKQTKLQLSITDKN